MTDTKPATHDAAPEPQAPWQEPVRGGHPDAQHWQLPGLEQLRRLVSRASPAPPLARLTGMQIVAADAGTAVFEMPLSGWLCAPQGAISIGALAIPADAAVGCAILADLPPATPFTTSELSLRLLEPVAPRGRLIARGKIIQVRRTIALAEVQLSDEQDRLLAHGSSLCFIQAQATPPPPQYSERPPDDHPQASPDPFERPVQGEVIPAEAWRQHSGLDVLRAQLAGTLPAPPIHFLTGLSLTAASEREVSFALPATPWLCAPPPGRVQGGAVALLAEAALNSAIQGTLPAGTALAPIDLKVNYVRPLAADGRLATASGQLVHAGRRIAVAHAQVSDADGRVVALATGSAVLLPGRPASLGVDER